jgi:predicted transcriptional regulator
VSRSYIAKVELGRLDPPLAMVERIGEALGLDIQVLIKPPNSLLGIACAMRSTLVVRICRPATSLPRLGQGT